MGGIILPTTVRFSLYLSAWIFKQLNKGSTVIPIVHMKKLTTREVHVTGNKRWSWSVSCCQAGAPSSASEGKVEAKQLCDCHSHRGPHCCFNSVASQLSEVAPTGSTNFPALPLIARCMYPLILSRKQMAGSNEDTEKRVIKALFTRASAGLRESDKERRSVVS